MYLPMVICTPCSCTSRHFDCSGSAGKRAETERCEGEFRERNAQNDAVCFSDCHANSDGSYKEIRFSRRQRRYTLILPYYCFAN